MLACLLCAKSFMGIIPSEPRAKEAWIICVPIL